MIRYILNKMLLTIKHRYDYDVHYMQYILKKDIKAFCKLFGVQIMSSHADGLPTAPLFAARLRAILWDDCGPCTQLVVNMALEEKVHPDILQSIIEGNIKALPEEIALVVNFTDFVLSHSPEADELRERIRVLWGDKGLIAIGYNISALRVYPTLKYTLGYGKTCNRIQVKEARLTPDKHFLTQ